MWIDRALCYIIMTLCHIRYRIIKRKNPEWAMFYIRGVDRHYPRTMVYTEEVIEREEMIKYIKSV